MGDAEVFNPSAIGSLATHVSDGYIILRLLSLDQVWSNYLNPDRKPSNPDFEGLQELARMMDQGIVDATEAVGRFEEVFEHRTEEFIKESLGDMRDEIGGEGWPFDEFSRDTNIRQVLLDACVYAQDQSGHERDILFEKMQLIESGQLPGPDLTFRWKCVVRLIAVAGVSVAAAAGTLVLGPFVAVGAGLAVAAGGILEVTESAHCHATDILDAVVHQ